MPTKTLNIKCAPGGEKFDIEVDDDFTVQAFKLLLEEKCNIPADQQRLIYKGYVLRDSRSIESYSIAAGHTVLLVRGRRAGAEDEASQSSDAPAAVQQPAQPTQAAPPVNAAANPFANMFNMFGGQQAGQPAQPAANPMMGMAGMDPMAMQQQLMQNPEMMREMMNSPMMQGLMNNPELIQQMMMNNPQMRQIIDQNPQLAHVLNDPAVLRQSMEMARNPELMREMMRNSDRAMQNIEAHPEGFNALRSMYENIQEPMMEAAIGSNQSTPANVTNNPAASTTLAGGNPNSARLLPSIRADQRLAGWPASLSSHCW